MASESHFQEFKRTLLGDYEEVDGKPSSGASEPGDQHNGAKASAQARGGKSIVRPSSPSMVNCRSSAASGSAHGDGQNASSTTGDDEWTSTIKQLCLKMNIRYSSPLNIRTENIPPIIPDRLLRILRCELQSKLSAIDTSETLRKVIENSLDSISYRPPSLVGSTSVVPQDSHTEQKSVFKEGVGFEQLWRIFRPGDLIYSERSELAIEGAVGQCCRVDWCAYTKWKGTQFFTIRTLEWKWYGATSDFCLVSGTMHIEEYTGKVALNGLGVFPLAMMESDTRVDAQKTLISRGKLCMDLFKSTRSLWGYQGPSTRYSLSSVQYLRGNNREIDDIRRHMLATSSWDSMISSRVIVASGISQIRHDDIEVTPHAMNTSEPIHDETYMMFSPYVWVQPVTSSSGPLTMVHLDYLIPIVWNEVRLDRSDEKVCSQISATLQDFQQSLQAFKMPNRRPAGQMIIIVSGDIFRATSIIEAVAERHQRGLFEIDLLDFAQNQKNFIEDIMHCMDRAARLQGIVCLQNFSSLVARRSYDDQRRCSDITAFLEFLEVYCEIVVICLEKGDTVDGKLRRLGPVYVSLDDDSTE